MLAKVQPNELPKYLNKVRRIYDLETFVAQDIDLDKIREYYTQSSPGYWLFHSHHGAVHMALCYDGEFTEDGYFEQPRIVQRIIVDLRARNVLELASGKGFNTLYLAERMPDVQFTGIDLTPVHVKIAVQSAQEAGLSNVVFLEGDFHHLPLPDDHFDYAFVVESLCHATNMKLALESIYHVLKPGSALTVFDGFRKVRYETLSTDERMASLLVEKSMAVGKGYVLDDFLEIASSVGFSVIDQQDLSEAIRPNLERFQLLGRGFFKSPSLARAIKGILPSYLVQNAIAGVLMPFTVGRGIQGYFRITLRRN